jgi:BirA family biotin operon repressor/biotin-[acetyl-CoA-carboxylase] ligase
VYSDLSRPPLPRAIRGGPGWRVEVVTSTGSTNADVADRARAGEAPGLVLVAEEQTAGRGRLGRSWVSPPRAGLHVSALLTMAPSPWVPLLAGVAVARTLRDEAGLQPRLKWPNDVLVGDRKIAGILAEVVGAVVVLGIGLNVSTRADELPADRPATSVAMEGGMTDRATLLRSLLHNLAATVTKVDYLSLCDTVGREVDLHLPDGSVVRGGASAVDDAGRLVVDGTAYAAGDVVHLR